MKFFRYKQVARLNFVGYDDELNNVGSSYYNTKFKLLNNNEINTKLFDDINIGVGVTNIISTPSSGIAHTLFTRVEHGLNRIQKLSIVSPGAGYGSGSGSVLNDLLNVVDLVNSRSVELWVTL